MVLGVVGAALDEYSRRGFSIWRSACRAAGLSPGSLAIFTLELLPLGVLGALLGGLILQLRGIHLRHRGDAAGTSLASHGGCALAMAIGLPLCALPVPLPAVLAGEVLLAIAAAGLLHRLLRPRHACAASGISPIRGVPSA